MVDKGKTIMLNWYCRSKRMVDKKGEIKMILENTLARIRGKRCELKLSQRELAEKLGISTKSYSQKENGIHDFTLTELFGICTILKCSISDIFLE